MQKNLIATVLLWIVASTPAVAAQPYTGALAAPVNAWVNAFNTGQTAFPDTAFTDDCSVIDEFPPFSWGSGRVDIRHWYAVVVGAGDPKRRARFLSYKQHLTLAAPTYVRVKGSDANVTFPATLSYLENGKTHVQRALFTVVERVTPNGWRINANAWAISSDD